MPEEQLKRLRKQICTKSKMLLAVQQHEPLDSPCFDLGHLKIRSGSNDSTADLCSVRSLRSVRHSTDGSVEFEKRLSSEVGYEARPSELAVSLHPSIHNIPCTKIGCDRRSCGTSDKVTIDIEDISKLGSCMAQKCAVNDVPQAPGLEGKQQILDGLRDIPPYLRGMLKENGSQCAGCPQESSCDSRESCAAFNSGFCRVQMSTLGDIEDNAYGSMTSLRRVQSSDQRSEH